MIDVLGPSSTWTREVLALGLDVALKAAALGLLAFVLHALLGRRRPLVRSVLWNACLAGLLLLPASAAVFPRLSVACLPGTPAVADRGTFAPARDHVAIAWSEVEAPAPMVVAPPPERQAARFNLGLTIVAVYLGVAGFLILRLLAALAAVGRLRRASVAVEAPGWLEALERWRERLGLRRPVRLARSGRADVPMVVGWLRPLIILPETLVGAATSKTIDAVILHELAHVRRGDYAWNLVLRLVQVLYWPHPVAWLLSRVIGSVREQACDELCIYWMGDAREYRATLLDVASGLVRRRPWQALGLAMARSSRLGRRIALIDGSQGRPRCLLGGPARVLIVLATIAACGFLGSLQLARRAAAAQTPAPASKPGDEPKKAEEQAPKPRADEPKADPTKPPPISPEKEETAPLPRVRTVHPKRMDFAVETTQSCLLQAFEPVSVHTRIAGVLQAKNLAHVGDRVESGQVLAELDATEIRAEFEKLLALEQQALARARQAEAAVKVARAALEGSRAKLQDAELAFSKAEKTLPYRERALAYVEKLVMQKVVSPNELDEPSQKVSDAKSDLESAKSGIAAARAALEQGEAELSRANAALDAEKISVRLAQVERERVQNAANQSKIVSPIAGIVMKRNVEADALVRPDQGQPMFVIARTDRISAITLAPESEVPLIDPGDPARVYVGGSTFEGKVTRTAYAIDPPSRTLRVEIDLPNSNGKLRPGMSGQATIVLETHPNALVIPATVLDQSADRWQCIRVVNGRTVSTPVSLLGRKTNGAWEVREGLDVSDELIDFGDRDRPMRMQRAFKDGTRVEVVPDAPKEADRLYRP
jgi:beta-lactamase regulating signal transducer with metallopeptidase domain/multidrug resistance efflux pump